MNSIYSIIRKNKVNGVFGNDEFVEIPLEELETGENDTQKKPEKTRQLPEGPKIIDQDIEEIDNNWIDRSKMAEKSTNTNQNEDFVYEWNISGLNIGSSNNKSIVQYFDYKNRIAVGSWESPIFNLTSKLTAKVDLEIKKYKIILSLKLVDSESAFIDVESISKVTYIVKSPNIKKVKDLLGVAQCYFNQTMNQQKNFKNLIFNSEHFLSILKIGNGHLRIKVLIEREEMSNSTDGVLIWRFTDYKLKKKLEKDGKILFHQSPYFYTGPNGYRVQLRLNINELSGVSASLAFYCGKYDVIANLSNIFPHEVIIILFNQLNSTKNLIYTQKSFRSEITTYSYTSWGIGSTIDIDLEKTSLLENNGYVINDSLLIKVAVQAL
ncbi:hypothetical protein CHUAL_007941 [Chamberlinius hualienensis]